MSGALMHSIAKWVDPLSRVDGGKLDLGYDLLKKKPPGTPALMPNLTTQNQAATLAEAQAAALRQGRAATILTSNATTADQLGP